LRSDSREPQSSTCTRAAQRSTWRRNSSPRDQARDVGDGEADIAGLDDAQVRHQRGERVVRDLRAGRGERGDQGGLAGGRVAHQRDVGDGLQLQDDFLLVTGDAQQGEARGLALLRGQGRVAEATLAAGGGNVFGALADQVGQDPAVAGLHHGAFGHREDQRLAEAPAAHVSLAAFAVLGVAVGRVVVGQQRGGLVVDAQDDVASVSAVAAVGAAERLELLTLDGDAAVASGTAGNM
jgi:hypothetical protein